MNRSESIAKISAALVKAQSEMGGASKEAKNPFFKSSYADYNAVREATIPVLNTNGITVLQPTTVVDGKQYIETILIHETGEYISSLTEVVVAKLNDPQAAGSGQTYAKRYGLQSFLCVGSADDDGEAAMGRNVGRNKTVTETKATVETKVDVKEDSPTPLKKSGFGVKKAEPETEEGWN